VLVTVIVAAGTEIATAWSSNPIANVVCLMSPLYHFVIAVWRTKEARIRHELPAIRKGFGM
jgi:hypothetical protein